MTKTITCTVGRLKADSYTKHMAIFGISGTGKDIMGERYITTKVGKHKVIDLFSEERGEGMFYSMKSTNQSLNRKLNWLSSGRLEPQEFKNDIIMFLGRDIEYITKLPANVKVVTFSEEDITNDDLIDFLAFNESQRGLMQMCLYNNMNKNMTFTAIETYLKRARTKGSMANREMIGMNTMSCFTILRRISVIKSSGLFYTGTNPKIHKFRFEDMIKNKDTITTVSTLLLPSDDLRGLALGIVMKKIIDTRKKSKDRTPVLFYIREASYFYHKEAPVYYNLIKESINKILREGRDNLLTCVLNTQLPQDLPNNIYKQFGKILCLRVPDPKILLQKALVDNRTMKKIANLQQKGTGIYIYSGGYAYPVRVPPSYHQKKSEGFDVFSYLSTKFGNIDYSDIQILDLDVPVLKPEIETAQKKLKKGGISNEKKKKAYLLAQEGLEPDEIATRLNISVNSAIKYSQIAPEQELEPSFPMENDPRGD